MPIQGQYNMASKEGQRMKRAKGISLMELAIVAAILAIAAAIGGPTTAF
jgi:prepilin-type N-terminal cleavage/methylation domain-containing protein